MAMAMLAAVLFLGLGAPIQAENAIQSNSIEYQIMDQRATQAAIWAMPAVSVYDRAKLEIEKTS